MLPLGIRHLPFGMTHDQLADYLNWALIAILVLSFIIVMYDRLVEDATIWEQERMPASDKRRLRLQYDQGDARGPMPSVFDDATVDLSLVVPASGNAERLQRVLDCVLAYFEGRKQAIASFTWELILVDVIGGEALPVVGQMDGSVRVLRVPQASGVAGAWQAGGLHARGRVIVLIEEDEEAPLRELERLEQVLAGAGVVVAGAGWRLSERWRKAFRWLLIGAGLRAFAFPHYAVRLLSRNAARWIFPNLHLRRGLIDPELLTVAKRKNLAVREEMIEECAGRPITWANACEAVGTLGCVAFYHGLRLWPVKWRG